LNGLAFLRGGFTRNDNQLGMQAIVSGIPRLGIRMTYIEGILGSPAAQKLILGFFLFELRHSLRSGLTRNDKIRAVSMVRGWRGRKVLLDLCSWVCLRGKLYLRKLRICKKAAVEIGLQQALGITAVLQSAEFFDHGSA